MLQPQNNMVVPHIVELATRIASNTLKVSDYLASNDLPQPSFDLDAPLSPVPREAIEIEALRQAVLRDTSELRSLMLGPRDSLFSAGSMVKTLRSLWKRIKADRLVQQNVLLPQQAITRFGLARNLPVGQETTFAEMAELSGQTASNIRKVVRAGISQRIFREPRPGVIIHSAASRLLAEDPGVHDYVATVSDELWSAAA